MPVDLFKQQKRQPVDLFADEKPRDLFAPRGPKDLFQIPAQYPTEPSLFGVTPGRQMPGPEPYPKFDVGMPPETVKPLAPLGPEHDKAGPLEWHLIPQDQRLGDIEETIKDKRLVMLNRMCAIIAVLRFFVLITA